MTKSSTGLSGLYFVVALYLGSTLKTGDLVVRFGVAIALFFVIPGVFYALVGRTNKKPQV